MHTDGGSGISRALQVLSDQGVHVSIITPYTPESNGLAERTHATILSLARTCLTQPNLPLQCWDYAVQHVSEWKNYVRHSVTDAVPYTVLYGRTPTGLQHLRPFGCKIVYSRGVKKLGTFEPRVRDGLCLYHEGGGVYQVLDIDRVVRTKHVKAEESRFPGLGQFDGVVHPESHSDDLEDVVEVAIDDDSDNCQRVSDEVQPNTNVDKLTYIPPKPSTYGVIDDEDSTDGNISDGNDDDEASPTSAEICGYSLRPHGNVN